MEKIRISKVEDVTMWRRGTRFEGNLHLMPHHIVFNYLPPPPPDAPPSTKPPRPREVWITYPMISHCVLRPSPPASHQSPSIRIRCRDFTFFAFHFLDDKRARDVYDSIRGLSCKIGRLDRLLAFSYVPKPPEDKFNGWEIYDARREWKRLGISPKDSEKGWRISEINKDYKYSKTYPELLVVPTKISDNVLNYAGNYRSRARIPVLVYRHPINNCSITRSSQPQPGIQGKRNPQDEKLVAAIWATNQGWKTSGPGTPNPAGSSPDSSVVNINEASTYSSFIGVNDGENENAEQKLTDDLTESSEDVSDLPKVYGAQQQNFIVDARPTLNAMAMQTVGLGSEQMKYYPNAEKAYLGIDNIHVMRKSLQTVIDALKDTDITSLPPNRSLLNKSGWIRHIDNIMRGTRLIAHTVGVMHSHVLIHCSDGWDRTSQLSALSQICLDPYYRTLEGFIVLVEKDWLSFGHMFRHRSGFLGSEKWFDIENERVERDLGGGGNAFENALRGAKGLFNRHNESSESLTQTTETNGGEMQPVSDVAPSDGTPKPPTVIGTAEEHRITKVNELSPVFHQFLDATYQLMYQYPTRFEFNERFLRRLLYHLYSCQYGTFLFDNEKERVEARAAQRTRSVWDYFLCRKQEFINPKYDAIVDDSVRGKERMIFPQDGKTRWWAEVFGCKDEDMNTPYGPQPMYGGTPALTPQTSNVSSPPNGRITPVRSGTSTPLPPEQDPIVTGTETADQATGAGTTMRAPSNILPSAAEWSQSLGSNMSQAGQTLAAGIAKLGVKETSRGVSPGRSASKSPAENVQKEIEVEMQ
ncbi:phosphatases II [Aaosphaeria arxii CBS 175.79]|uniref:Phosphatases II n=1 Tax=Aaosphaeria arxii CBS 175.79 TaxID=1450172 RepID=A0A6A5Y4T5_9PLEO|nr:phosphatases II [Aaosphaeria arxii CBS 175.79]KAF2020595.1 phosphatases II [Aaosphaeria arxii CBS 175.79]